jgi:hypothetical protein
MPSVYPADFARKAMESSADIKHLTVMFLNYFPFMVLSMFLNLIPGAANGNY